MGQQDHKVPMEPQAHKVLKVQQVLKVDKVT